MSTRCDSTFIYCGMIIGCQLDAEYHTTHEATRGGFLHRWDIRAALRVRRSGDEVEATIRGVLYDDEYGNGWYVSNGVSTWALSGATDCRSASVPETVTLPKALLDELLDCAQIAERYLDHSGIEDDLRQSRRAVIAASQPERTP